MNRLKGKAAIVVGAGSIGPGWGNGKATAVTFAREGAQVLCIDRNGAAAEETAAIILSEGGTAVAFTADVSKAGDVEAMWRARDAQVPMGHMGDAWDVANAALFLASDESKYVTGIELIVDGGITVKS